MGNAFAISNVSKGANVNFKGGGGGGSSFDSSMVVMTTGDQTIAGKKDFKNEIRPASLTVTGGGLSIFTDQSNVTSLWFTATNWGGSDATITVSPAGMVFGSSVPVQNFENIYATTILSQGGGTYAEPAIAIVPNVRELRGDWDTIGNFSCQGFLLSGETFNLQSSVDSDAMTISRPTGTNNLVFGCGADGWDLTMNLNGVSTSLGFSASSFSTTIGAATANVGLDGFGVTASLYNYGVFNLTGTNRVIDMETSNAFLSKNSTYLLSGSGFRVGLPITAQIILGNPNARYTFKQIVSGISMVSGQGNVRIDGQSSYSLTGINKYVTVQYFSGHWYVVGNN